MMVLMVAIVLSLSQWRGRTSVFLFAFYGRLITFVTVYFRDNLPTGEADIEVNETRG